MEESCGHSERVSTTNANEAAGFVDDAEADGADGLAKSSKHENAKAAALGTGEKLVLGHPLAATIGDSARCMQNLEKVGSAIARTISGFENLARLSERTKGTSISTVRRFRPNRATPISDLSAAVSR